MILEKYCTDDYDVKFELVFLDRITIVGGDSGIGKTFIYRSLQDLSEHRTDLMCLDRTDYINNNGSITRFIDNAVNKAIVIDNADIILSPMDRIKIVRDKRNQYIIFGRNPAGLCSSYKQYAKLVNYKDNKVKLVYPLLEGET